MNGYADRCINEKVISKGDLYAHGMASEDAGAIRFETPTEDEMPISAGKEWMQIPSHQIHNVLKVYCKQLSQARAIERRKGFSKEAGEDKINLSAVGKRQAIIEKVAADIVERITQSGPQDQVDQEIVNKLEDEFGQHVEFNGKNSNFVFNVINKDNEKTTAARQFDDPEYFMKRLEQLAKEAVDKNMEL